ncbi:UNVERIFIED_ORG: hypothetical protein M2438_003869 [Methylobacterium sp. SuP10 SLI 274]|nr:hypothetical protein [Methylobacterium sp. SuP10 SLI 274]
MTLVATLIANPARPAITDAVLAEARRVARTEHQPRTLHGEVAAELLVPGAPDEAPALTEALRAAFGSEPIDVAVLPHDQHRRKRLFLADMDSTMIEQECIDELADVVGIKDQVAAITERAMRGEVAFEPALRERVGLLERPIRRRNRWSDPRRHPPHAGRRHPRCDDAGARRLHLPRLGRIHPVHRPHRHLSRVR